MKKSFVVSSILAGFIILVSLAAVVSEVYILRIKPVTLVPISNAPAASVFNKTETSSTTVQSVEDIEIAKQQAASDKLREQMTSNNIIDTLSSSSLSPEYVLGKLFSKDHWPHAIDPNKPIITDTVEGIIIRDKNVKVVGKTMAASSSRWRYNVTLKYPQFSGFSNAVNQEKLNKHIENEVKKLLKNFQVEAKRSVNSYLDQAGDNELSLKWDIYVSKKEFVSLRLNWWERESTMRSMSTPRSTKSFSYDVASGQELVLKDFFLSGSDFVSRIRDIAKERDTAPEDLSVASVFDQSNKNIEDFLHCLITERGIVCGYDYYGAVVGEYFKGVSIEWKDLEDILNTKLVNRLRE